MPSPVWWMLAILIGAAPVSAVAQCGPGDAVGQARRQGCLSPEAAGVLDSWLKNPAKATRAEASAAAAQAYECLLRKGVRPNDLSCFEFTLRERVLSEQSGESACFRDRLTGSLLALREIQTRTGSGAPNMLVLDHALGAFLGAYSAAWTVASNPNLATSVKLAASWCLDINAPFPAPVFVEEFADAVARIAAVFPDQGRHLGAVLSAVVRDARRPGDGPAPVRLEDIQRRLIEPDQQNLAGTSHFYLVHKRIEEIVPNREGPDSAQTAALLSAGDELLRQLETGVERMQNRASAWRPFEEYSDVLEELAWRSGPQPDRETWHGLNHLACDLLRRALEVSSGAEETVRLPLQTKLLDRIASYGSELARIRRYRQVVEFESRFVDGPERALTRDQECYVHAHLAQAYYALADHRRAMEHLAAANSGARGKLVTADDLMRLK